MAGEKALREGSARKRADILAAARERFLADGFDGASVDAISATAGVSKRTVYDYFGDKQALLGAVVEASGTSLMATITAALDEYLTDPGDLETALVAFAQRILSTTLTSSDYATITRLVANESSHLQSFPPDHWMSSAPEDAIAIRFEAFDRNGLLSAPNPRLAADHFVALAFGIALDAQRNPAGSDAAAVRQSIVDGVRAFLRAYAPAK
jgi:TetR/AcrR family transcriptional regulator, mexJK operon transcriptional repressor